MVSNREIDVQQIFERKSKKVMKELEAQVRKEIIKSLHVVGKKERINTAKRIASSGNPLGRLLARSNKIHYKLGASHGLGSALPTLQFGTFEIVEGKGRMKYATSSGKHLSAGESINISHVLAKGIKGSKPTLKTGGQKKRGFIFAGNHPDTPKTLKFRIKPNKKVPDVEPMYDYLGTASEKIIERLENEIPKAVDRAMRKAAKKGDKK